MTDNQNNTDDFLSRLQYKKDDYLKHFPVFIQQDIKKSEIYTDFLLCALMKKSNGIIKIDQIFLDHNKADISLKWFLEKQNATKYGYAEIIKQTENYIKFKITENGILHFKYNSVKYKVNNNIFIKRISLYLLKLITKLWPLFFVSANIKIKEIMESGIIKLILFVITLITFILKKDEIIKLIHKLTE